MSKLFTLHIAADLDAETITSISVNGQEAKVEPFKMRDGTSTLSISGLTYCACVWSYDGSEPDTIAEYFDTVFSSELSFHPQLNEGLMLELLSIFANWVRDTDYDLALSYNFYVVEIARIRGEVLVNKAYPYNVAELDLIPKPFKWVEIPSL